MPGCASEERRFLSTAAINTIKLLRSRSLPDVVQGEIERRILDGEIGPGERVKENRLSVELGVSRGPIREACRTLVEAGLMAFIVNRGFFVREITRKDATDVYDVRASLMSLAARTLAARLTPEKLQNLALLIQQMDLAQQKEDFDAFYALNLEFHDRIVDYTENDRLKAISEGLVKELHLFRRRSLMLGGGLKLSNREHKQILSALEARDPDRAAKAMEEHILAGKARFLKSSRLDADA